MSDYISRKMAIKAIEDLRDCYNGFSGTYDKACIIGELEDVPAAGVREKGKWLESEEDWRHQIVWWCCSECNFPVSAHYNFCPNCGADMRRQL